MSDLPSPQMPLYNHPLPSLEGWLADLGAVQRGPNSCFWDLQANSWSAEIELGVEELSVRWGEGPALVQRQFPYGLSRADVESAILAGP
ncbi:MAG: DUF3143 domain-containing protein [Cyanobacteria bacterium M_surface_10_m1_298]|nr:DUF3143 domain-containing protein [Cyanobacteria bacterium M_surface_10_m1_298]